MDDEEDKKDLNRERLKTLAVGFAAFSMFMPIQLVTISSKHLAVALELKESFTGLYIAKLLSVKNLILITCSIFMYILQYIIPGEDVVFTLFSHFLMVLSRLILFILLFTSSSLALDYYNCMAFISFTLGIFQMSFFSLTANYVTFLSAVFKLSRLFAWLLQLFFDVIIPKHPLLMIKLHFFIIFITTSLSFITWIWFCIYTIKDDSLFYKGYLCKFFLQCSNYLRGDYNVLELKYIGNFNEDPTKEVPNEVREVSPTKEEISTREVRRDTLKSVARKNVTERSEVKMNERSVMKKVIPSEMRKDMSTRKNEVMTSRNKLKKSKGDVENCRNCFKYNDAKDVKEMTTNEMRRDVTERSEVRKEEKRNMKDDGMTSTNMNFPTSEKFLPTSKNIPTSHQSKNFPTSKNFPSSKNIPTSHQSEKFPTLKNFPPTSKILPSSEHPPSLRSSGPPSLRSECPSTLIDIKDSMEDDEPHFIRHLINSSSPMLLFITTTLLKCILIPGILPYSLIEREKCHFINMLMTPFALISTLIVHYLKNKCPSIRKSWNHDKSIYWNLLWLAVLPVFIIFCITFIALHYTDTQLSKYIIGNLNAISIMVIIFYISHPLVESAGFLGVTSNVRHNGRILKNGLKVVTTSQLISILIYLIGYKISIGYTITKRLYHQSIHNSNPTYHMNTFKSFFFWTFQSLSNGFNDFINEFHGNIKDYI